MQRKLVQQGNSTLMISLPSKWIKEHNLQKGSLVHINEAEGSLEINAESTSKAKETSFTITSTLETHVRFLITNAYRRGFTKVNVTYQTQEQFDLLYHTIQTRLLGFEITSNKDNQCVVENISEPSADQFDNILRKIFYNIDELFGAASKKQWDLIEEIEERTQRFDNFCRRMLQQRPPDYLLWTFLVLVIHGQREIYHMTTHKLHNDAITHVHNIFTLVKNAYFENNVDYLKDLHEANKAFRKLGTQNIKKDPLVFHYLLSSARKFFQSSSPLTGIILDTQD